MSKGLSAKRGFIHLGFLLVLLASVVLGAVAIQYQRDPNSLGFPKAGDPNIILHENWQTTTLQDGRTQTTQLYNEFDTAPTGETKLWSKSLSIDGCFAQSKVVDGTCVAKDSTKDPQYYGPLLNSEGAGIDIMDYEGRKILRHWLKQDTWHSHGARLNLTYGYLKPYSNRRIYARYQMMFPKALPVVTFQGGGLWTSVGVEMKAHGWNTNATIQHNYNQANQVNLGSAFIPISNSQPFTIEANHWYQMDVVWDMYPDSRGKWEAYIDGVKFGVGTGQMATPEGFGLWIFNLYGNMFQNQVRGEMYIGDVTLSTQPIGASATPGAATPAPTITATATPQITPAPITVVTPRPTPTPAVSPIAYATPISPISTGGLTWYSTLNSKEAITSPSIGTAGSVGSGISFTQAFESTGISCNTSLAKVRLSSTNNFNKSRGRLEFWVRPNWNKTDNLQHTFFGDNVGAFSLSKTSDNRLQFYVTQSGSSPAIESIFPADYTLTKDVWNLIAIEWDENAINTDEMKIYVNGVLPRHTDNSVDLRASLIPLGNEVVICDDSTTRSTNATLDDFKIYSAPIGIVPNIEPQPTPIATPAPQITTTEIPRNSFRGIYYNNKDYTDQKIVRIDPSINFNWRWGSPDYTQIQPDSFSARWDGLWDFVAGNYEFSVDTDDGIVIMIDGQVVLDQWKDQSKKHRFSKYMTQGAHYIRVGYYENTGYATAVLNWRKK